MTRFSLVFEHFDIAFSDDAQVLRLHQRLFSAFGIELLQVAFSVLEYPMSHHALRNICKNLLFETDYIQATNTFLTMRAGIQTSYNFYLFP